MGFDWCSHLYLCPLKKHLHGVYALVYAHITSNIELLLLDLEACMYVFEQFAAFFLGGEFAI